MADYEYFKFSDGIDRKVIDGDSLYDSDENGIRIPGMDTYEIDHGRKGDIGSNKGQMQRIILEQLIKEKGFNNIVFTGEEDSRRDDGKPRKLANLEDNEGRNVTSMMYYEGLVPPRGGFVTDDDIEMWNQGRYARLRDPKGQDPYYAKLREQYEGAGERDWYMPKTRAINEREFNPKLHSGVMLRRQDRNIHNEADSAFISGFSGGVDGLQGGLYGVLEMLGNKTGIEALERYGRDGVEFQEFEQSQLPRWITNIDDINSVSDFSKWAAGALGGSLPYFALMAGGFVPGFQKPVFTAMSMIYTGQTFNEMTGTADENSMGYALTAGILQASWERLGGQAVFKLVKPKDLGNNKGVRKAIKEIVNSKARGAKSGKRLTEDDALKLILGAKKKEIAAILKDFKKNDAIWKAYAATVSSRALGGMVGEGTTEGMQEATQVLGAYLGSPESKRKFNMEDILDEDGNVIELGFKSQLKNAIAAGGLLGGGIAGGKSAIVEPTPYSTSVRQMQWEKTPQSAIDFAPVKTIQTVLDRAADNYKGNEIDRETVTPEEAKESKVKGIKKSTQEEINNIAVDKYVDTHKKNQQTKSGLSKTSDFIIDLKWISAGYQVLAKNMKDVLGNLELLRAEMEYSGSPYGRFFAGQTLVQERRTLEGDSHKRLKMILDEVLEAVVDKKGRPVAKNAKNRREIFLALRDSALAEKTIDKYAPIDHIFSRAFQRINDYETLHENKIREIDPNYYSRKTSMKGADGNTIAWSVDALVGKKISQQKVGDNKEGFKRALKEYTGWESDEELEQEYQRIMGAPTNYDYQEWGDVQVDPKYLSKKPGYIKRRIEFDHPAFKDFLEENTYDVALTRATEIAHYVSDMKSKGFGGSKLNAKILAIRDEIFSKYGQEGVDKYMPEVAFEIRRHYEMHMGEYHKIKNDTARAAAANAGAMMSFAYMGMAVFSSASEIGLMFRNMSGVDANDEKLFVKMTKQLAKLTKQSMIAQMKKIRKFEGDWADTSFRDELLDRQIARGMTGKEYGAGHIVDAEFDQDRRTWLQRKGMPMFYKWTGLTGYTTFIRMGRDSMSNDWLAIQLANVSEALYGAQGSWQHNYIKENLNNEITIEHLKVANAKMLELGGLDEMLEQSSYKMDNKQANSYKALRDLGVDPQALARDFNKLMDYYNSGKNGLQNKLGVGFYNTRIVKDSIHLDSEKELNFFDWLEKLKESTSPDAMQIKNFTTSFSRNLEIARSNYVDAALVNPDPGKRPPMYSDGRTRLLFMFQGYLAQFSSKIARPILQDLAGKGAPQDQMNAAMVMMSAIALGFLGQMFKDEIKYGDKPAWLTDAEYIQRGVMASGLMGQTERLYNLVFPLYKSEEDTVADRFWAEIGPLTGTIDSITKGTKWALRGEGEKALNQYLKVLPGGSFTQQRQAVANIVSGNNGEQE